jgi:hypothetical protein
MLKQIGQEATPGDLLGEPRRREPGCNLFSGKGSLFGAAY